MKSSSKPVDSFLVLQVISSSSYSIAVGQARQKILYKLYDSFSTVCKPGHVKSSKRIRFGDLRGSLMSPLL